MPIKVTMQTPVRLSGKNALLMKKFYQRIPGYSSAGSKKLYSQKTEVEGPSAVQQLATPGPRNQLNQNEQQYYHQKQQQQAAAFSSLALKRPMTFVEPPYSTLNAKRRRNMSAASSAMSISRKPLKKKVSEATMRQVVYDKFKSYIEPFLQNESKKAAGPRIKLGLDKKFLFKLPVRHSSRPHSQWSSMTSLDMKRESSQLSVGKIAKQAKSKISTNPSPNHNYSASPNPDPNSNSIKRTASNTRKPASSASTSLSWKKTNYRPKEGQRRLNHQLLHADALKDDREVLPSFEKTSETTPFQSNLMPLDKTVKNLISLGPKRTINTPVVRPEPSDPLSGWKHPTKLMEMFSNDETSVPMKNPHLAQALPRKPSAAQTKIKNRHLVRSAEPTNKWYAVNKIRPVDYSDRSETARQKHRYMEQGNYYNEMTSKPAYKSYLTNNNESIFNPTNNSTNYATNSGKRHSNSTESYSDYQRTPMEEPTAEAEAFKAERERKYTLPPGESSCSTLTRSMRRTGQLIDDLTTSPQLQRYEKHRQQLMQQQQLIQARHFSPASARLRHESAAKFYANTDTPTAAATSDHLLEQVMAKGGARYDPQTYYVQTKDDNDMLSMVPETMRADDLITLRDPNKYPARATLEHIVKTTNRCKAFFSKPRKY